MAKETKLERIRELFEEFARIHKNSDNEFAAKYINDYVQSKLEYNLNMCAADFASTECGKDRAKNKELFIRIKKGIYKINANYDKQ